MIHGQLVALGRRDAAAVEADVIVAQVVGHDEDNVRPLAGRGGLRRMPNALRFGQRSRAAQARTAGNF